MAQARMAPVAWAVETVETVRMREKALAEPQAMQPEAREETVGMAAQRVTALRALAAVMEEAVGPAEMVDRRAWPTMVGVRVATAGLANRGAWVMGAATVATRARGAMVAWAWWEAMEGMLELQALVEMVSVPCRCPQAVMEAMAQTVATALQSVGRAGLEQMASLEELGLRLVGQGPMEATALTGDRPIKSVLQEMARASLAIS